MEAAMIYEFRTYTLKTRSLAEVEKRYAEAYEYRKKYSPLAAFWHTEVGPRAKLSPIVLAGGTEFGQANRFVHIWAYKSMDQRLAVREQARKAGVWPPPGGGDELLAQSNKLMMPSSFSPLQ